MEHPGHQRRSDHAAHSRGRPGGMILVTGATGTVGSDVVRRLVALGQRPRVFVRDPATAHRRFGEHAEYVAGDLDRPETLQAGLVAAATWSHTCPSS